MQRDPYQILGVDRSATAAEIRSVYLEVIRQVHPDAGGDEEQAKRINDAYATLSDPVLRAKYDQQHPGTPQDRSSDRTDPINRASEARLKECPLCRKVLLASDMSEHIAAHIRVERDSVARSMTGARCGYCGAAMTASDWREHMALGPCPTTVPHQNPRRWRDLPIGVRRVAEKLLVLLVIVGVIVGGFLYLTWASEFEKSLGFGSENDREVLLDNFEFDLGSLGQTGDAKK